MTLNFLQPENSISMAETKENKLEENVTKWRVARQHDDMSRCTSDSIPHRRTAL
jgi:hypothetical protein